MDNRKTNYQAVLDRELETLMGERKKLLLHSCCGPCSSYVIEYLSEYFDITVLYFNPSIFPYDEFKRRAETQKQLINDMCAPETVKLIICDYDHDSFLDAAKGSENDAEGGTRCYKCYAQRLEYTAKFAKENEFDYFCTTLSVSPYKNAQKLNELGKIFSEKYGIKYLFSDFKKRNGYKRSIELSKQFSLYRQEYCGCEFSIRPSE